MLNSKVTDENSSSDETKSAVNKERGGKRSNSRRSKSKSTLNH